MDLGTLFVLGTLFGGPSRAALEEQRSQDELRHEEELWEIRREATLYREERDGLLKVIMCALIGFALGWVLEGIVEGVSGG